MGKLLPLVHCNADTMPLYLFVQDLTKAKGHLPSLQRAARTEAVVEFVASGSRLRLYIAKGTYLVTFLLAGINCPRGSRPGIGGAGPVDGEPFGDEALQFTKDKCLQHEVEIHVESMDKAGNFIGWLWVDGHNLSVALVEAGLATVHFTAERSEHYRALKAAEDTAKAARLKVSKQNCSLRPNVCEAYLREGEFNAVMTQKKNWLLHCL